MNDDASGAACSHKMKRTSITISVALTLKIAKKGLRASPPLFFVLKSIVALPGGYPEFTVNLHVPMMPGDARSPIKCKRSSVTCTI